VVETIRRVTRALEKVEIGIGSNPGRVQLHRTSRKIAHSVKFQQAHTEIRSPGAAANKGNNMNKMMRHIVAGALTSGAIAAAGLGLGAGFAAADRPAPTGTWCPGQPLPMGGATFGWDMNVCHDYWFVNPPEGNVPINMNGIQMGSWVWIGGPPPWLPDVAPPSPPPPPAPGSYCATNPVGCHFFGPYGPGSHG
jgi:hypothetical protein